MFYYKREHSAGVSLLIVSWHDVTGVSRSYKSRADLGGGGGAGVGSPPCFETLMPIKF